MRLPDDGVTGANGRNAQQSAPETPEGSAGAHGSLMQRYRGAGAPPAPGEGGGDEVNRPLPPPRPADASESAAPAGSGDADRTERSRGEGSRTWAPSGTPSPVPPRPATGSPATRASGPATSPSQGSTVPSSTVPSSTVPSSTVPSSTVPSSTGGAGDAALRGGLTVTRGVPPGVRAGTAPRLDADRVADFKRRWRDVQSDFVDDPRQAVRGADALAREVLDALSAMIADKQRVDGWTAGDGAGTEDLRVALRQYRTLVDRLLEL